MIHQSQTRTVYDSIPTTNKSLPNKSPLNKSPPTESPTNKSPINKSMIKSKTPLKSSNGSCDPKFRGCDPNSPAGDMNSGVFEKQSKPRLGENPPPLEPLFGNPDLLKEVPVFGGNWSRTKYDQGSLAVDTRQATSAVEYILDPTYAERCNQVRPAGPGWLGKQGVSYDTTIPLIDTESELFNLNRLLTKDPNYKYIPYCPTCEHCSDGYPCGEGVVGGCPDCQKKLYNFPSCNELHFEYTRVSNPISTLKETGVNRFQPICLNPQDRTRWEHPGEVGINYRMVVKDNHIPCIPYPIDPSPLMPRGGDIPCQLIKPTCSAYTAPLNNYHLLTEGALFSGWSGDGSEM